MNYETTDKWDEGLWQEARRIYEQAFPEHGRKPDALIRRMFERKLCVLHTLREEDERTVVAMALTGIDRREDALVIDYLAVRENARSNGLGGQLLDRICLWAKRERVRGLIVEVEADPTEANKRRIRFWQRCGFQLTDYVHHYIWVPEPYRAMALSFDPEDPLPADGAELFRCITRFHRRAYRRMRQEADD